MKTILFFVLIIFLSSRYMGYGCYLSSFHNAMNPRDCCHMTHLAYVWSLGDTSCLEKGVIYQAKTQDKTIIFRNGTVYAKSKNIRIFIVFDFSSAKWDDCQSECRRMDMCLFFSFSSEGCALISRIYNKTDVSDISAVSGPKECGT